MITGATLKYQYFLTDYLGSTRVVLQEDPAVYTTQATFEKMAAAEESQQFIGYEDAPRVSSTLFDHTTEPGSQNAIRLSGLPGESIGPARSVDVMPGDTIRMEVFGKYVGKEHIDQVALLGMVVQVAGMPAVAGTELAASNGAATSAGQESLADAPLAQRSLAA